MALPTPEAKEFAWVMFTSAITAAGAGLALPEGHPAKQIVLWASLITFWVGMGLVILETYKLPALEPRPREARNPQTPEAAAKTPDKPVAPGPSVPSRWPSY